jgi:hypothetical protein
MSREMPANIFAWADVEKVATVRYLQGYGVIVRFFGDTVDYHLVQGANKLFTCSVTATGTFSATVVERARRKLIDASWAELPPRTFSASSEL